jgi:hypothetical protein
VALDALVEVGHVRRELAAGERLHGVDPAPRVVHPQRRRARGLLEAELPEDLHRADLEVARAGVDRGAGMALDRQGRDAVVAEQRRGREPDQAAADDEDGDVRVLHGEILAPSSVMWQLNLMMGSIRGGNAPRRGAA